MEINKRKNFRERVGKVLAGLCVICAPTFAQTVNINGSTEHQTIRGFGGMNAPGWIADLTSAQVDTAFGNGNGQLGLSIMRMRIDPNADRWGIQVPAAVRAKSHGAILLASPWSPPAYMKTNNNLNNGGKLRPEYYGVYTDHLLSFTSFMASNNASVYAVSIQNEPDWHPNYESAEWSATDFVNYLSSQGARFGSLKVVAPESLNFNPALSDPFLNNATTAQHVDIIGGHLYGRAPRDYPLARSKGKELWMTEHYTESQNSANAWPLALDVGTELHQSMVANFNAYIWWYIRRSYGLLTEDGNISKRGYLMAQYSKFVRPGYMRIAATEQPLTGVFVTAYKGPDNRVVIVAVNTTTSHRNLNLNLQNVNVGQFVKYSTSASLNLGYGGRTSVAGNSASIWVDPQSVATFVSETVSSSSSSIGNPSSSLSSASLSSSSQPSSSNNSSSNPGTGVTASVEISNDWGSGYCANLLVNNNTNAPVTWNVSVTVEGTVNNLWNGSWSQSGSTLTVAGVGWNSQLQPGQTESSVGFCASR